MIVSGVTPMHHLTIVVSSAPAGGDYPVAVVATLSKGYDLDYIRKQVDCGPVKDAAGYYIQASESGGEPPGRWWGPGAKALGLEHGQTVEREPYDLLFGQRKAPDGGRKSRRPVRPAAGRRTALRRRGPGVSAAAQPPKARAAHAGPLREAHQISTVRSSRKWTRFRRRFPRPIPAPRQCT